MRGDNAMQRDELLEILTKDRKIAMKLRRRAIFKRIFALITIIFGLLMIGTLIQTLYWDIFLDSDKNNFLGMAFLGVQIVSVFGLALSDSYNPLLKTGKFNYQFFILIELIISEMENGKRSSYFLSELILLLKRYLDKIYSHATSLYVFESDEITLIASKLSGISSSNLRNLVVHNNDLLLSFFKYLNNLYECKINDRPYNDADYNSFIKCIDELNSYEAVKPNATKKGFQLRKFIQRHKKALLIGLIIIFGSWSVLANLLGIGNSILIEIFTIIGVILGVLALKD